jgi:hypothetical protein
MERRGNNPACKPVPIVAHQLRQSPGKSDLYHRVQVAGVGAHVLQFDGITRHHRDAGLHPSILRLQPLDSSVSRSPKVLEIPMSLAAPPGLVGLPRLVTGSRQRTPNPVASDLVQEGVL